MCNNKCMQKGVSLKMGTHVSTFFRGERVNYILYDRTAGRETSRAPCVCYVLCVSHAAAENPLPIRIQRTVR